MRNVTDLVGNTPVVESSYKDNRFYLKLESGNPGLSIKDRVAFYICQNLDESIGLNGKRIVEYSSGNLAIGLAQASKLWRFHLTLIITSKTSLDKIRLLQRFGTELIMVDEKVHSEDPLGFRGFAAIIASVRKSIFIDQYNNRLNPEAHQKMTGPEIYRNVPEADYVFTPMGTGGTASGIARYFKENRLPTQVVGVTPDSGVFFTHFHRHQQARRSVDSMIEGVGEDFIPQNFDEKVIADVVEVSDIAALQEVEQLINDLGLFVGGSSGLAIAGTKKFVDTKGLHDKNIVIVCPDSGNRYLSNFSVSRERPRSAYQDVVEHYRKGKEYPKIL